MKIDFKQGTMGENDTVVLVDGKQISMLDFAEMAIHHMRVREAEGLKSEEFMIFLNNCIEAKKVTDELLDSFFHTKTEEDLAQIAPRWTVNAIHQSRPFCHRWWFGSAPAGTSTTGRSGLDWGTKGNG